MGESINFSSACGLFSKIYKRRKTIGHCKPYSDYQESTQKTVRNITTSVLDMLSGGDTYRLLSDVLGPEGVGSLYPCDEVCSYDFFLNADYILLIHDRY